MAYKRNLISNPRGRTAVYGWQQPYIEAVLETDDEKLSRYVLEAISSIEQRLLSPIDKQSDEYRAILEASNGLADIIERRGLSSSFGPKLLYILS
jgi:hypothetical protein